MLKLVLDISIYMQPMPSTFSDAFFSKQAKGNFIFSFMLTDESNVTSGLSTAGCSLSVYTVIMIW